MQHACPRPFWMTARVLLVLEIKQRGEYRGLKSTVITSVASITREYDPFEVSA